MAISLKYNNIPSTSATSFVTLTDIPNLVEIDNSADGFSLASLEITISGSWSTASHVDPWFVTINGETITGVDDYRNAINKNFFISTANTSTAASMAKAIRNCPSLAASFTVRSYENKVELLARNKGAFTWSTTTNATAYTSFSASNGSVSDELIGGSVELSLLDGSSNFITSLEKNYYESGMAFDVTPILTTIAERGKTVPYKLEVSATKNDGTYTLLGSITGNSISQGYMVNQGFRYIPLDTLPNNWMIAQNVSRGSSKGDRNNTLLYVYGDTIPVSWYHKTLTSLSVDVMYLSSAHAIEHTETKTLTDTANGWLHNAEILLNSTYKRDAYYIALRFYNNNTTYGYLVYNVIKPLKATEYYQRVYWRNSYGGISFVDMTSSKSETRDVETTTFKKNVYEYYTQDVNESEIPYDIKIKYSVTVKSHIFEEDGKWVYNDLMQSSEVWVEQNGETYRIILDSVSVDEDNRNNLYTATIKYHYSQPTSLD